MILDLRTTLRTAGAVEDPDDVYVHVVPVQLMALTIRREGVPYERRGVKVVSAEPQKLDASWFKEGDELFADRSM
jgi:hypothetical protein